MKEQTSVLWLIYPSLPPDFSFPVSFPHPPSLYLCNSILAPCQAPDITIPSPSPSFHPSSNADATAVCAAILRIAVIPGIIDTGQTLRAHKAGKSAANLRLDADAAAVGASVLGVAVITRVVNANLVLVGAREGSEAAAEATGVEACARDGDLVGKAIVHFAGGSAGDGGGRGGGQEGKESRLEEHFGVGFCVGWVFIDCRLLLSGLL